jgi:hypothetical protein
MATLFGVERVDRLQMPISLLGCPPRHPPATHGTITHFDRLTMSTDSICLATGTARYGISLINFLGLPLSTVYRGLLELVAIPT